MSTYRGRSRLADCYFVIDEFSTFERTNMNALFERFAVIEAEESVTKTKNRGPVKQRGKGKRGRTYDKR